MPSRLPSTVLTTPTAAVTDRCVLRVPLMAPHSRIQSPGRSDALCCCGWPPPHALCCCEWSPPHALCCLLDCRLATLEVRSNRPARWPDSDCRCLTPCGPGAQPISRGVSCIRADTCWTVCLKSIESNSCRLSPKSPKPSLLSKSRSQSSCILSCQHRDFVVLSQ